MRRRPLLGGLAGLAALTSLASLAGLGTAAAPALAHPYHTSSAVAHVRGSALEVTLSVAPEDLAEALRRITGKAKAPDVDRDPKVPELAKAYVQRAFVVSSPQGPIAMTWHGLEVESDTIRLFFEFRLPAQLDTVTLHSGVFFELAPAQVNRVLVIRKGRRRTLRFRAESASQRLIAKRSAK